MLVFYILYRIEEKELLRLSKALEKLNIIDLRNYSCVLITLMRGRPGTRRIRTEVFFGINIASSRYSAIAKNRKYKGHMLQLYQRNRS